MRNRLLVRHFLSQFVENDFAPDVDRHQVLALAAAALITVPLFTTVFMSVKYLMQPVQTPAWTVITALGDQMVFCATSMLVSAIIATIEWDALALSARDLAILGVLPVPRRQVVRAKASSLVIFVAMFVIALNALPVVLHPPVMVANLSLNPIMVVPLMAAQALSTMAAGVFGFVCVVALREVLHLSLGRRGFERVADVVRSVLLFSLLLLLLLVPSRLSGPNEWVLESGGGPVLQRPASWFAALHGVIASRVLEGGGARFQQPNDDDPGAIRVRRGLPNLASRAWRGVVALLVLLAVSTTMYLWNARRFHVLPGERRPPPIRPGATGAHSLAGLLAPRPAKRAGLLFLVHTALGSPVHRTYLIASVAVGAALLLGMMPATRTGGIPVRTLHLAAQTLMSVAVVAGFRATIRTAADTRAAWVFGVTDTGNLAAFRHGVRLGVLIAVATIVVLLLPFHTAAWGIRTASMHALNGAALGWLLVEIACGDVEQPLVQTIPPNDAMNTVGAVFLGAIVIAVFVLARIERAALTSGAASVSFAFVMVCAAAWVRSAHESDHRAATLPPPSPDRS